MSTTHFTLALGDGAALAHAPEEFSLVQGLQKVPGFLQVVARADANLVENVVRQIGVGCHVINTLGDCL